MEIQSENVDGIGRVYFNDDFRYPSVTTVLQVVGDKSYLDDWREKVGAEWADAYTQKACDIGSALHDDYEQYLLEKPLKECLTDEEKLARKMFKASLLKFNRLIKSPIMQEVAIYSTKFKVAGRFDLLALGQDGEIYLVDFKNTKRDKTLADVEAYKYQLAFYHRMLGECYPQYKIKEHLVIMVNRDCFTKVFRFKPDDVTDLELMKIRGKFFKEFGL